MISALTPTKVIVKTKDLFVLHRGNLKTLCIFDDIKELFWIFRSDDGIIVVFFLRMCLFYWSICRQNNLMSEISFKISQHGQIKKKKQKHKEGRGGGINETHTVVIIVAWLVCAWGLIQLFCLLSCRFGNFPYYKKKKRKGKKEGGKEGERRGSRPLLLFL